MLDRRERRALALHEAAHALACLELGVVVHSIGIGPACSSKRNRRGGQCVHGPVNDVFTVLVIKMAGPTADARAGEDHAALDHEDARRCLSERYGRAVVELDAPIVRAAQARAESIVSERWHEIQALAAALILQIEIEGDVVRGIVRRAATERIEDQIKSLEEFA